MKNHTQSVVEKLFPELFLKIQNWAYLWINILKFYIFCFYYLASWGLSKWFKLSCEPLVFISYKAFLINKKRSGTSLSVSFSAWFSNKNIFCYTLLPDQISISGCFYFVRYWAIGILQLFVNQVVTPKILKLTLSS